ncbi:hypothetical protein MHIB_23170 [Mycolicibacter hiberniae]|uniref:Chitin-binding type-2 domain-containing protein n=1 Tax=Mycolicibacter hiberniae TaxID=29314 RepID=A0A7I7X229_9MYCO|nr:hypothetical protein MHIB_23170 [Mycolicibacter hiberniae]
MSVGGRCDAGVMMRVLLVAAVLAGGALAPPAAADPIPAYCYDQRLCDGDFGSTYYCPDTGRWVGPFGACDALVTGGYRPGGQRPNEGNWDAEDDW